MNTPFVSLFQNWHALRHLYSRNGGNTGGAVAAPIFQRIVEASLRHLAVLPTVHPASPMLVLSPIVSSKSSLAGVVTSTVSGNSTHRDLSDVESGVMPNLRGLSAREAVSCSTWPRNVLRYDSTWTQATVSLTTLALGYSKGSFACRS